MEMEYKDTSGRRGKAIIVLGLVLAVVAGGAAFFLINQAQQLAGRGEIQKVSVVVAARDIPARKPIEPDDLVVREVPLDATNAAGVVTETEDLVGRVLAVTVFKDQLVTTNLIASAASPSSAPTRPSVPTPRPGARSRSRWPNSRPWVGCSRQARRSTSSRPRR